MFTLTDENGKKHEARGRDFEEAAINFAESQVAANGYPVANNNSMDFDIRDSKTKEDKFIRIFTKTVIEYNVEEYREIKEKK
jgi:hypothetical protein